MNNSWISIIKLRCLPIRFTRVAVHGRLRLIISKPNNTIFAVVAPNCTGFIPRDLMWSQSENPRNIERHILFANCGRLWGGASGKSFYMENHSQLSTENAPQIIVIHTMRRSVDFLIKIHGWTRLSTWIPSRSWRRSWSRPWGRIKWTKDYAAAAILF